jgi:metal-dependent HD superfamily phosphatase/phosphodiesterase
MTANIKPKLKATEPLIQVASDGNLLLEKTLDLINNNVEIATLWKITNVTAIKRLGMTDHGRTHFQIVAHNGLALQRLLTRSGVQMSIVRDYGLTLHHAEMVVLLASLLHDLGMSIHRSGHEEFSLFLVNTLLRETLNFLPLEEKTIVISEVLHAIISHRADGHPLTIEAGIVRVADALDMTEGRSRIPYDEGKVDIHSVSAMAIDEVEIHAGKKAPIEINISMNHTAGIFQVDELLKRKVMGSGLEAYLEIKVYIDKGEGRQLLKDFFKRD